MGNHALTLWLPMIELHRYQCTSTLKHPLTEAEEILRRISERMYFYPALYAITARNLTGGQGVGSGLIHQRPVARP
jgi:hypothetical protein